MAEMIRRMVEAGALPAVMAIAVEAFESVSGTSPGHVRDMVRKYERERRQNYRKKHPKTKANTEANDAVSEPKNVRDMSGTSKQKDCDSSLLPFLTSAEGKQEESKKGRGVTRARGTWMEAGALLSDADRKFAIEHGARDPDAMWAEFIDYWIGIPGQRGTKLDWSATWRNRVRAISTRGKPHANGSGTHRTELQDALDRAREFGRGGDLGDEAVPKGRQPTGR